jgi:hypothetical protein
MNIPGTAAAMGQHALSQQLAPPSGANRHHRQVTPSISDIDAQGSSVASPPSSTSKVGSRINITA